MIGRVAGAHGIRGWLRVAVFADGSDALNPGGVLYLDGASDAAFEVRQAAPGRRGGEWRVALVGVDTRDAAEALKGQEVAAPAEALGSPGPDCVWGHQLVGCAVESEQGVSLGRVREICLKLIQPTERNACVFAEHPIRWHHAPAAPRYHWPSPNSE